MEERIEDIALSCSLDAVALGERREEWRALDDGALLGSTNRPGGLTATYRGDQATMRALRALVEAERECCPDYRWTLARDEAHHTIRLDVDLT
ncbi:MAG: hypothetical protein LC750_07160 [Actinobacteria bacterium]|nr:hypothetical protein [Actinomycetota bacterium]